MRGTTAFVLALATAAGGLPGCADRTLPPRGQLLLYVDTDAPLARAAGEPYAATDPGELFDQMRVEVVSAGGAIACADCRRDFAIDRQKLADEATSFGLDVAPGRADLTVRVRLFRAVRVRGDGDPPVESAIDEVFVLPPIGEEGIVERTAHLTLARVGRGPSASPAALLEGRVFAKTLYPGVLPRACAGAPKAGEVCVPGGAFWMANAETNLLVEPNVGPERVVIVSPFRVDATEVTVAQLRASGVATSDDPRLVTDNAGCTYTEAPGNNEVLPITCLTIGLAQRYCALTGKMLLTEAQFELIDSGLRSRRYVWGVDPPSCTDTIFARDPDPKAAALDCLALGIGPAPPGSGTRDVLELAEGKVYDLVGNVRELVRDTFQPLSSDCWRAPLLVDPVCHAATGGVTVRGGGVDGPVLLLRVTERAMVEDIHNRTPYVGFRCARPGL